MVHKWHLVQTYVWRKQAQWTVNWGVTKHRQITYCAAAMAIFGRRWGRQQKVVMSSVIPDIFNCRISWKSVKHEGIKLNCLCIYIYTYIYSFCFPDTEGVSSKRSCHGIRQMCTTSFAPHWLLFWLLLNILVECEVVHYPGVFNSLHMEGVTEWIYSVNSYPHIIQSSSFV